MRSEDKFMRKVIKNICVFATAATLAVSAAAMIESLGEPGIYAQYSPASAGSCAFTVFEIL